ncbi:LacI family transcriptional regulator [Microlunatus endophyticus]|uniref:LacI family transcriptional regulator n=1 Tax=Microlunatus endophyticus TaxID=1716077 RepID=A0A917W0Z4_9ACTN|nr:LacI family DNA-binding transcriptional regulator [Microlunatus endophyticus]GGL49122.1 LacI family transcriptional regulator [Microlunatus endophyticus]
MARRRTDVRRVSQADVARRAEVSTGIVSSVINGRDYGSIRVSDATKERVWAAVRELGYVPNLAARNLARGSNRLVGVFTYQPVFPYESRDFYHDFLIGVEEAAEQHDYNLLMITAAKDDQGRRSVYAGGVNNLQLADGAVLVGSGEDVDELTRMTQEGFPFVYIGQRRPAGVDISYVAADYRDGTRAIVQRLYDLGHRRIAMLQDPGTGEPVPSRRPGFADGCVELGIAAECPQFTMSADRNPDPGVRVMESIERLVDELRSGGVTALVIEQDSTAAQVSDVVARLGVKVPGDLSLVSLSVPPLVPASGVARLQIPRREMGRRAVEMLMQLLQPDTTGPVRVTLECGLDEGTTLGPPDPA